MRYTTQSCTAARNTACAQCGCGVCQPTDKSRDFLPVMVFIEPQSWGEVYTEGQALARGTLFPVLDKPFFGKGGCCNG